MVFYGGQVAKFTVLTYFDFDYSYPYLAANDHLREFLAENFSTGEVFFPLSQFLLRLNKNNSATVTEQVW